MARLTEKQKRFIEEYLIDLNATQAAIRAGYSVNRASELGYQLLHKTTVSEAIQKAMAKRSRRTGITADRVLTELAKIGFSNAADIINFNSAEVNQNASADDLACIQSVKVKTSYSETGEMTEREVRLYDKKASLELIGKHLGMFKDKVEVSGALETSTVKLESILEQLKGGG